MRSNSIFTFRSLLRRSPLLPGESLSSLVARLAILNGYSSLSILERLFQSYYFVRGACFLQEDELIRLAVLTGIPYDDLLDSSDVHFRQKPSRVSCSDESFSSGVIAFRPTQATWYCPKCLAEVAYHRLIWRPISSAVCLKHACQLVNNCPQCKRPVSIYDVVLKRCSYCHRDLSKVNTVGLQGSEQGLLAQTTMQKWLNNCSVPNLNWPQQDPLVLCLLAEGLAFGIVYFSLHHTHPGIQNLTCKNGGKRNLMQQLSPLEVIQVYSLAVQYMVNWPEGFRSFLYWCEPDPKHDFSKRVKTLMSYLAQNLWNSDSCLFIWNAFHTYSDDRLCYTRGYPEFTFEKLPAYANSYETAQILGVLDGFLPSFAEKKLLIPARIWQKRDLNFFYKREDLRNLSQYI